MIGQNRKPMKISLIAMSGSGKSYWSQNLARQGFEHFDCDRMIASRLGPELTRSNGAVMSLGEWMGFPFQAGYLERETRYLDHEKKVLQEIFEAIESSPGEATSNVVIDTTGSVIYTGKQFLDQLRRRTTVVHLESPLAIHNQMLQAYRANPRPVLWQGKFVAKPDEDPNDTLARCYPELLAERERLYKRLAHVTIAYHHHRKKDWEVGDFLAAIKTGR